MKEYHNTPVELWGVRQQEGEKVGLELEVEGDSKLPIAFASQSDCARYWTTHEDNSLRRRNPGDVSIEYVSRNPISKDESFKAIKALNDLFRKEGAKVFDSYRTSVHVHVNMSDQPLLNSLNYVVIWTLLEDMLVEWCGKDRIGNRFCLRFKDADGIFLDIKNALNTQDNISTMCNQDKRYAAMNIASLARFGSVEFRSMRGTMDQGVLELWINTLLQMRRAALDFAHPREIIDMFSGVGADRLLSRIFPDGVPAFIRNDPKKSDKMFEGMRLAQEVAYAIRDWEPRTVPIKKPVTKKKLAPHRFENMDDILQWENDHLGELPLPPPVPLDLVDRDIQRIREDQVVANEWVRFDAPLPGWAMPPVGRAPQPRPRVR